MALEVHTDYDLGKEELYKSLLPQINALIKDEKNFIANVSNIASALRFSLNDVIWAGFYFKDEQKSDELVLGPFQGKTACTRLQKGKGVCGTAFANNKTVIVDDVELFPGHIYCDSASKSEIVVPISKDNEVVAVLDIDSANTSRFDEIDKKYLEQLVENILYIF